jgi:hypothetical protein
MYGRRFLLPWKSVSKKSLMASLQPIVQVTI